MLTRFVFVTIFSFYGTNAYFTLPGKCPENVELQQNFKLADFFGTWHQAYHFSSDHQLLNNCSKLELLTQANGIYLNQSRIDRGLFHRYSIGRVDIPSRLDDAANLNISFIFKDAPRRLVTRQYPFRVLATNYNYFATVYTCQYSSIIDKHFIYVWVLSRKTILNDVSKELAVKPLSQLKLSAKDLVKDDNSNCQPKYYEDKKAEPVTFRFPVLVKV